jgi:hypothetical protein
MALILVSLAALSACDRDAMMSSKGFRLDGEELPLIPGQEMPYVELGGKVTKVKTYGELITAIINPSHELARGYAEEVVSENGESNMYIYNDHMTVQELIDIVMFLQPHYDVVVPQGKYRVYPR